MKNSKIQKIIENIKKENVVIKSSGTSGSKPKKNKLSIKKIKSKYKRKNYPDNYILGFFYDLESWAAINTILFCQVNDIDFVYLKSVNDIFNKKIDHLCMTPSQIRQCAMLDKEYEIAIKITLGGEYSTQHDIDLARKIFPNAIISHVYSSTETGDICSSSDMKEGFCKEKFKNIIVNKDHVVINEKKLNDIWVLKNDRYYFKGRSDCFVKVAGLKVNLEEIEKEIMSLSVVEDCVLYAKENKITENILILEYVGKIDKNSLKLKLRETLKKHEMPIIKKVKKIKLNKNGKKQRINNENSFSDR